MSNKALDGLRVIEYAQGIGVPYAGKLLADLGAEVIKVERPGVGDRARHIGPFVGGESHPERSCVFLYVNTNKQSVTLDLDQPEGAELFRRLAEGADVLLREGQPEYFEARGLGYEVLRRANPGLILSSNTPFGEWGPYKDWAATPFTLAHMSGNTVLYPHGTGDGDKAPCIMGGNFEEYDVGDVVAVGVLAALHWRHRSGRGQYIENASLEARFQELTTETVIYPVFGLNFNRSGETQRQQASLNFPCKDGFLCPFLSQAKEFDALAVLIGKPEWLEEAWYHNVTQRRARAEEIAGAMREWGARHTIAEAVALAQAAHVPIGPSSTPADVVHSEQFEARGFFTQVDHPVCGRLKMAGRPFLMEKTPHTYDRAAPLLGADNKAVLGQWLGCGDQELQRLAAAGVI